MGLSLSKTLDVPRDAASSMTRRWGRRARTRRYAMADVPEDWACPDCGLRNACSNRRDTVRSGSAVVRAAV